MRSAVVITGLGTLGAFGVGREALSQVLASGQPPRLTTIDRAAGFHRPSGSRGAFLLGSRDLSALVSPATARRMGAPSRMALAAARLAVSDAGILETDPAFAETAVVISTAFGPALFTERLLSSIFKEGPETASPALFTESVASAAASQVALNLKARGPSLTVTQREAGDWIALGEGARLVRTGRARRALVGSVEEMTPLLHAILDRFHTLATADESGEEVARPLDRDRRGVVAAEGSTLLVLESESEAAARGAKPLCRIVATGAGFDPTAPDNGFGADPEGLGETLRRGIERSGRRLHEIDLIASGAAGSIAGDRLEVLALATAWRAAEASLPVLWAPKSALGEWGGGHLAAAVLAVSGAALGPTHGYRTLDPELGVAPYDGRPLAAPKLCLATSVAAGGSMSWSLLEAVI
ncbi:MAG: beta-ketoacyl synthase N-terminal-like domain-containing protein [Acidobacteriota bacterium]